MTQALQPRSTWESDHDAAAPASVARGALGPSSDGTLLGRFTHWLSGASARAARRGRLPFAGLPPGIGEVAPGETALVLTPDDASREQLLLALLGSALAQRRVTWLCNPAKAPARVGPDLARAALTRHLHALSWTADAALHLRELGATHLVREMLASGMARDDLLVLDGFDPWLSEMPAERALEAGITEAAQSLERWARLHAGPVLALAPEQHRGQPLLPLLAGSSIGKLASFAVTGAGATLEILRWHGPSAAGARNASAAAVAGPTGRFSLDLAADGLWHCRAQAALDPRQALAAPDRDTVHTTRDAVRDAAGLPDGWRVHASLDSLLVATRDAVAATVVLAHDHADAVAVLGDAVTRLRREHPHLLKIIIRETDASLRRNGELALLRLGANVIVERALGFSHVAQRARELRDTAFGAAVAADARKTVRSLAPDPVQGYLPPRDFCAAVERMLERTANAPIEHSLIQLPLLPHIAHLDALLACCPRRDGDLITADGHGISLFLFGCAGDDVMAAIESLFTVACSELAQHVEIASERVAHQRALAQLRAGAEDAPLDYTTILRSIAPETARAAVQATVLPMRSAAPARCVQATVLPLREATV